MWAGGAWYRSPARLKRGVRLRMLSKDNPCHEVWHGSLLPSPNDDNVTLRAPLAPGGVNQPLVGKEAVCAQWWQPLEPALAGVQVQVLDHYVNESLTSIVAAAEITITITDPPATLRVADRFTVNAAGRIVEQENHFDPRDVTNPGWQRG